MAAKRPNSIPPVLKPTAKLLRDPDENAEGNIGMALRAAYESAVQEDIPAEMLDLLSKLR